MIYCNTVSQRNFISIHFHTCISVEILCLFTKVLNFSNHMRSVELFYEYFVVFLNKAGIPGTQLTLALEPESAALYCQSGKHLSGLEPMNPGDKFLLLDCGGILCVMNIDFSNA